MGAAKKGIGWSEVGDPRMSVVEVVPIEETAAKATSLLLVLEAAREVRHRLESFELALGVGIVV